MAACTGIRVGAIPELAEAGLADRRCVVCRELTKLHEEVRHGTVADLAAELAEEILDCIREDAEHFGCTTEVEHIREIVRRGTSAHWQTKTYQEARAAGADEREALQSVVDMLIRETAQGLPD